MTIEDAKPDNPQTDFDFTNIYDLVSEPDQYDGFMRSLLGKLDIIQDAEDKLRPEAFGQHWGKASALVDKVTPWRPEKKSELDKFLALRMQAMMALDKNGCVVATNSAARGLYNLGPNSNIRDLPLSGANVSSLEARVKGILEVENHRNSPNDVGRFQNHITKKPILFTLNIRREAASGQDLAILMTNEIYWPQYLGPILQDLFNLTRAEVEIVRLMMNGDKVNEIIKKRSASITTIRTQLRSIFSKTDTDSQRECIRMVIGLAMMHDQDDGNLVAARIQATVETAQYPRENQRKVFKLKNGRQIEYSVFGAKTGPKVKGHILFYHDQAIGDTWFKDAVIAASRAGIQIIAPLRPGFGRTSLYEGEASDPLDFAPEIKMLLDHLEVKTAAILTQRSGLVHALAAAQLMPKRFTKITAANPILPVMCDADLEGTNGYNLLIPKTRLHFPQALRFLCKAGFAFVTTKGPPAFVKALVRDSPKDLEWVNRADIMPSLLTALPIHREHGYLGNYGDIAYAQDWTPLLTGSPIPIRMVIGEHDMNVQWAAARRWARELSHAELHVLPDSGYFVRHQQPRQFLDWLKQDLRLK